MTRRRRLQQRIRNSPWRKYRRWRSRQGRVERRALKTLDELGPAAMRQTPDLARADLVR
jgi:hypothetical protein